MEQIESRKQHARDKLERVIRYARTHQCRRKMILDYFGDESAVANCRCDVCRGGNHVDPDDGAAGAGGGVEGGTRCAEEVVLLVRQMLSAIARLHGRFGVGMIAEVLCGAQTEKTQRWALDQLSVFGLLRAHSPKRVIAMLHRLMEAGLARQRDPEGTKFRPIVELTAAGIAVMKGEQAPPTVLSDLAPRASLRESAADTAGPGAGARTTTSPRGRRSAAKEAAIEGEQADPQTLARFERLRRLRAALAREHQLPAYVICHDRTLKEIARAAPASLEGLEKVKGLGPYKVRTYGEAILRAVSEASGDDAGLM
jgi:ATP-dependent DNA helicase RecQ